MTGTAKFRGDLATNAELLLDVMVMGSSLFGATRSLNDERISTV